MLAAGCVDGPLGPDDGAVLVDPLVAPVQFTAPASPPPDAPRVVVRRSADLAPVVDREVVWSAGEGTGVRLAAPASRTDSAGIASVALELGTSRGRYVVRARVGSVSTDFERWVVDPPLLDSVPTRARPGDTVIVRGRNFSPVAEHDVVRFGNVRAVVTRATETELRVEVPPCLPSGPAAVRVGLGLQSSLSRSMQIEATAPAVAIDVGEALVLDGAGQGAVACRRLPAGSYLLVLAATGAVRGSRYWARVGTVAPPPTALVPFADPAPPAAPDRQARWDAELRAREDRLLRDEVASRSVRAPVARQLAAAPPRVSERREFSVLEPNGGFRRVAAVVRWVGARAAFYEDVETPPGQLTAADYAAFGAAFDDPIAPTVTRIFGEPSDLDGNERVVVLFTPAVNRLTERSVTDGFIGGFFYGLDLLSGRSNSNAGEVFYALVPDPDARFGNARSRELVVTTVPTILAHELMHMVHFAERVLARRAPTGESAWLSEALAGMAEDRVGDAYAARGQPEVAAGFQAGNRKRARMFLERPLDAALITGSGTATLAERGASWLFLRYIAEQYGGDGLLGTLTRTSRTGIENVTSATGRDWRSLVLDWATAVYDGEEPGLVDPVLAGPRNRYRTLRPRDALGAPGQPYPLPVAALNERGVSADALLLAGAVSHYRVDASGPVTVAIGGRPGAPLPSVAGVALRVLRLR